MLLSWSLTMSTLQNSMFISQTLFFDLSASFFMMNHFLLFEIFFTWLLGPYTLLGFCLFRQPSLSFSFAEFPAFFLSSQHWSASGIYFGPPSKLYVYLYLGGLIYSHIITYTTCLLLTNFNFQPTPLSLNSRLAYPFIYPTSLLAYLIYILTLTYLKLNI